MNRGKSLRHFEYTFEGDVYLTYQMRGWHRGEAESEGGRWTFQPGNAMATSHVVKDHGGRVVASSAWPPFKKVHLTLEDGRILRLGYSRGLIVMDADGTLIVSSESRRQGIVKMMNVDALSPPLHITLGPKARTYPELGYLIGLCNYFVGRARYEECYWDHLASLLTMGVVRFE